MKAVVKSDLKSITFWDSKSYIPLDKKAIYLVDLKFYQKLFVLLISLSSILIFPSSPRELENICELYNSRKVCIVW